MNLRRNGPVLRVGHRGAAALAPANTLAGIEAALGLGVDLVELDVHREPDGKLVLSHSRGELADEPLTLDDALAFMVHHESSVGVLLDVKGAGWEPPLVEALRRHDFVDRAVASTSDLGVLRRLRKLEPELARSVTQPRSRLYLGRRRTSIPLKGPLLLLEKLVLPFRIHHLVREADATAMTLSHRIVTQAAVEHCHALGVAVLVWTVNDRAVLRRLDELGVDGVITDDPHIFAG
jgi:glycerophosphoryl diester phosphodiesterase